MKTNLLAAIAVLTLGACVSQPPQTLDQKLQGANCLAWQAKTVTYVSGTKCNLYAGPVTGRG